MSADKDTDAIDWYVEPSASGGNGRGRRSSRTFRDQERASLGLIVATSLLFVLFAVAIMFGGHAAIAPLLRHAVTARDTTQKDKGDIVYAMPDGVFCRHMTFDNGSGAVTEGAIEPCAEHVGGGAPLTESQFKWGAH